METLKSSKSHALVANQGTKEQKGQISNNNSKDKKKKNRKEKKDQILVASKVTIDTPSSKGDKPKKEKVQCAYCKRPDHEEHKCLKKQIDHLTHILEKNNINVLESIKQSSNEESNKEKEKNKGKGKGKALVVVASSPSTWVLDLGALHHMASSKEELASLEPCIMPSILMGDDTPVEVCGRGFVDVGDDTFHDVLCVPSLSSNLLSIYQITHTGLGKQVEFTPDSVEIHELHNDSIIVVGRVDHQS